jgi:hypothetical protein
VVLAPPRRAHHARDRGAERGCTECRNEHRITEQLAAEQRADRGADHRAERRVGGVYGAVRATGSSRDTPRRESPGTATIDVALDAGARVTAVRLVQSTGNTKTDYAATVGARNGLFIYVHEPGCPAGPTVYRLELTFS